MTEWHKARWRLVHDSGDLTPEQILLAQRHVFRVCKGGTSMGELHGCPVGSQVYNIHPEDSETIWGQGIKVCQFICEHELVIE